jgi:hypothetical protein
VRPTTPASWVLKRDSVASQSESGKTLIAGICLAGLKQLNRKGLEDRKENPKVLEKMIFLDRLRRIIIKASLLVINKG